MRRRKWFIVGGFSPALLLGPLLKEFVAVSDAELAVLVQARSQAVGDAPLAE